MGNVFVSTRTILFHVLCVVGRELLYPPWSSLQDVRIVYKAAQGIILHGHAEASAARQTRSPPVIPF